MRALFAAAVFAAICLVQVPHTAVAQGSLTAVGGAQPIRPIPDRPAAPDIAFKDEKGEFWGLVRFRGKVVVAMLWATWCPICYREMPKLDRLQAELGREGIKVVALSQDEGGADVVKRYYAKRGIENLQVFYDPGHALWAPCWVSAASRRRSSSTRRVAWSVWWKAARIGPHRNAMPTCVACFARAKVDRRRQRRMNDPRIPRTIARPT